METKTMLGKVIEGTRLLVTLELGHCSLALHCGCPGLPGFQGSPRAQP